MKQITPRLFKGMLAKVIMGCCGLVFIAGCFPLRPGTEEFVRSSPTPKEIMDKYTNSSAMLKKAFITKEFAPIGSLEPQLAQIMTLPYEHQLFSISVSDKATLGEIVGMLAAQANLSLILAPDVDKEAPIAISFQNLPLDDALDSILSVFDYYYRIENGILRVQAMKTTIFNVDFPMITSSASSETGGDVLGGGSSSGVVDVVSSTSLKGDFTIKVEMEDVGQLDAWKQIEEALVPAKSGEGGLLSEQGTAQVNRMSGTIVVTDRPRNLRIVKQFIERMSSALNRQVVIEAKIIEVILNQGHEYGINWTLLKDSVLEGGDIRIETNLSPGQGAFTASFTGMEDPFQLDAILDALASQGDVNILSSPRLNVLNNQSALISVGDIIPYEDLTITKTEDEVNGEVRQIIDTQPVVARTLEGITLGITPQISEEGVTNLHIVPIITEQTGSRVITIEGRDIDFPVFSIRETDTIVKIRNRETILMGGLIAEKNSDSIQKIPVVGDMPLFGPFFSHQQRSSSKSELVILLNTTVLIP